MTILINTRSNETTINKHLITLFKLSYNTNTPIKVTKRINSSLNLFLGEFLRLGPLQLGDTRSRFRSQNTTAPVLPELVTAVVEVGLDDLQQLVEVGPIARIYLRQSQTGAGFSSDQEAQSRFALHNAIRDAHLPAESGQKENQLENNNDINPRT